MTRRRAVVLASALLILVVGVVLGGGMLALTQTAYGREQIRSLLVNRLAPRIAGTLYLGELSGNLLNGVQLDSIAVIGEDGLTLLASGPITVSYDIRDMLDRRVLLAHVEVERPLVHIAQYEDGEWNFRRLFTRGSSAPRTPRAPGRGFGDFIRMDSATVHDGRFMLSLPWHPADSLRGARRDSAIAYNLAREDAHIRRAGEDFRRTWDWTDIQLASSGIRLSHPDSVGQRYDVASLAVLEVDPPFTVTDARGVVRVQGDSVWLDFPRFELAESSVRGDGKIVWGSDLPVRYDINVAGDSVSLSDVAWVQETLPTTGGGAMRLRIHNDPADLHILNYAITDMDVRTTGSRLRGAMTYGIGGPVLRVTDVALSAEPVDMDLLRTLAGGPFSFDWQGTIVGAVYGRGGPVNRFRVDSSAFTYRDAHVPDAVSRGSGRGELDILNPALAIFRGFRMDVARLDLRTPRAVNPDFARLGGEVSGHLILDSVWTDIRFRDADVVHTDGAGDPSHVTGAGRVTLEPEFLRYDIQLDAEPLDFTTLARSYPGLGLRGPFSGPVRFTGTLADLSLVAELAGAAGMFTVDGHFDLFGPGYSAVGLLSAAELDLATLLNRLDTPTSSLTGTARFALEGDSLANMTGALGMELGRGALDSVRLHPSRASMHFANGRAVVDTLLLETDAMTLAAYGALGLLAEEPDSLAFTLTVDSLGGFRRYLASEPAPGQEPDSLVGTLDVRGVLLGSAEGIGARGTVFGRELRIGHTTAASLNGTFNLTDFTGPTRGSMTISLDTAIAAGVRLANVTISSDLLGDSANARLDARSASGPTLAASAALHYPGDSMWVRLDSATIMAGEDRWALARPAVLSRDRSGIELDTLFLWGLDGGRILAAGSIPQVEPVSFTVRADSVPLHDLGLLAQANTSLDGRAAFELRIAGTRTEPRMTLGGALTGAQFGDVRLARLSFDGSYADRRLRTSFALAHGDSVLLRAGAVLPVDLALAPRHERLLDEAVTGNMHSERVDLSLLEAFTTAVRKASGSFQADVDLSGTVRQPVVTGGIQVADGALTLTRMGDVTVTGLDADIALLGDSLAVRQFRASSGGRNSLLTLAGGVDFTRYSDPHFDLTLTARDFHAIARSRLADLQISTTPDLRLSGPLSGALLTGGVRVERGTIYLPEFSTKRVIDLEDLGEFNIVDTTVFANRTLLPSAPPVLLRNLTLRDVGIQMGDDVWLRGPEANLNLGGRVSLTTARDPRSPDDASLALEGQLTANRGTYRLNLGLVQRTFSIERGSLRFFGEPDLNPALDIVTVYTVRQFDRQAVRQDVQVRAIIGGTMVNPQLRLTGEFAGGEGGLELSESDAVSYLVTGAPAFAVGAEQSSQLTAARVALASLGSYLGDRAAGGIFDVVQFQTSGLGQGDTRSLRTASQGILAGTRLGVGKQLSDRVFVSANAGLCQLGNVVGGDRFNALDFAESIGVKVDYRLGGGLALSAGVEPPTAQLYCGRDLATRGFAPTPRQWALDLFRTWRF